MGNLLHPQLVVNRKRLKVELILMTRGRWGRCSAASPMQSVSHRGLKPSGNLDGTAVCCHSSTVPPSQLDPARRLLLPPGVWYAA